jgi:hypothetical protein
VPHRCPEARELTLEVLVVRCQGVDLAPRPGEFALAVDDPAQPVEERRLRPGRRTRRRIR